MTHSAAAAQAAVLAVLGLLEGVRERVAQAPVRRGKPARAEVWRDNRFHAPAETSADILKLRELYAAMDRAVLDAYGGDPAKLTVPPCEFLLDYEDAEDEDGPSTGRQKKKPWRYRWPDPFRDEVLALLLELNRQRAEAEQEGPTKVTKPAKRGGMKQAEESPNSSLFDGR